MTPTICAFHLGFSLDLLRSLDNESIDLICIDPPFAKNQTWVGSLKPPLTEQDLRQEHNALAGWGITSPEQAAQAGIEWPQGGNDARFKDIWRWENDVHEDWVQRIERDYPALAKVIDATRLAHSEGTAAYLTYIAIRVIEMHRVIKETGSLYLHCDHTAGAYLRQMMDAVFGNGESGKAGFKNEITWKRQNSNNSATSRYGNITDTILFYSKSDTNTWNQPYYERRSDIEMRRYKRDENDRLYKTNDLTAPTPTPSRMFQWRGTTPKNGWRYSREKLEELYADGRILLGKNGNPRLDGHIQYLDEMPPGGKVQTLWDDIPRIANTSPERTGYPTQKPVALAERIILASSNPGDVVLDCFAGCAYVPVAAERNDRQWIACDISPRALTVLRRQFVKFHYAVDDTQDTDQPALITVANVTTRGPHQLPQRTDEDPVQRQDLKPLREPDYKVPASFIPRQEMLEFLLSLSDYMAWCCGFANWKKDGTLVRTTRNFHLDHVDPRSKDGSNQITNRAPLCPDHNIRKNNRRVHLAEYRQEIADADELMVNSLSELVSLPKAYQQAMDYYVLARVKSGIQPNLN